MVYNFTYQQVTTTEQLNSAYSIRHEVFCIGQNVDPNYERDGIDTTATHFIALDGKKAVGTLRSHQIPSSEYQLSRIAVLPEYQGKGVGKGLISYSEEKLKEDFGSVKIILEAQKEKIGFYQRLGYELKDATTFLKQNIVHVIMIKIL
ncbi:acyl-CoA N-acyltransferase [Neoconidiobolus thromboides FSU 785]|nr:acyl-CoA N-acyltransferase [Neoconidiobolus thromboides FSU 785]